MIVKSTWSRTVLSLAAIATLAAFVPCRAAHGDVKVAEAAQAYGAGRPVEAMPDGSIQCEAEEFQVQTPGWKAG